MPPIEMPQGRYLSCTFGVTPDAGGQTRALLMRNRLLAARCGVRPDVLTFGASPDYEERRRILLDRGLLTAGVRLLNVYEHYREHGWGEARSTGGALADLTPHRLREDPGPAGTPWRVAYRPPGSSRLVYDYLRADGTPYLRIPQFGLTVASSWRTTIQQVAGGEVVGEFRSVGQWFRRWVRDLAAGHDRAFVFIDSRHVVPHLVPMRDRRIHLIYLMHNLHVLEPRRWDSPVNRVYRRVLNRIDGMDAMVTLTQRQQDDIAERRGRTSNLFVVPNPVDLPAPPGGDPPPRDPNLVTIMARLEPQKRLTDAIAAFRHVVDAVPAARLDVYGGGRERERLQAAIDAAGLAGAVTLRGFDAHARQALWTSSAFLMTSLFEGYPLSTLESLSHGCPVVSYDIKYGPREQIADGVDGFLVPAGDVPAFAARVVELLRSPALVERMSAAARAKARDRGPERFLADWAGVLRAAIEQAPYRTRIDGVRLRVERPGRLGRLIGRELTGVLELDGRSRRSRFGSAELSLAAIEDGEVTELPLAVERARNVFRIRAPLTADDARLRLTWRNSAWETRLDGH